MRKTVVWCLTLVLLGCAAAPPVNEIQEESTASGAAAEAGEAAAVEHKAEEAASASTAETDAAEDRPAKREVLLPVAESRYRGDGTLEERIVFEYDSAGRLEAEVHTDAEGELLATVVYTYQDERPLERRTLEPDGELRSYHAFEYAAGGLLSVDTLYNDQQQPQTSSRYLYDEDGRRTRWEIYDGSGRLIVYTDYLYDAGKLSGIEIHGSDGELTDFSSASHDEEGRKTEESFYETPRKLVKTVEYVYVDGFLESEGIFNAEGRLLGKYLYQYDEHGSRVSSMFFDDQENITEIVEMTFDLVEVE